MMHSDDKGKDKANQSDPQSVAELKHYQVADVSRLLVLTSKLKAKKTPDVEFYFYAGHFILIREKLLECYKHFHDPAYMALFDEDYVNHPHRLLDQVLEQTQTLFAYPNETNLEEYRPLIRQVQFTAIHAFQKVQRRHTVQAGPGIEALNALFAAMQAVDNSKFIDAMEAHQRLEQKLFKKYQHDEQTKQSVYRIFQAACMQMQSAKRRGTPFLYIDDIQRGYEYVFDILSNPSINAINICFDFAKTVDGKESSCGQGFGKALAGFCLVAMAIGISFFIGGFLWMKMEKDYRGGELFVGGLVLMLLAYVGRDIGKMIAKENQAQGFSKALGMFANNMRNHAINRIAIDAASPDIESRGGLALT